jgi:hypothetical protein
MAPDDRDGVVVLGTTGVLDGRGAPDPLGSALLRRLLGLPDNPMRTDLSQRPERWSEICGLEPHRADRDDPFVFTVDVSSLGNGAMPVVFSGFDRGTDTPMLLLNGMAFRTRPDLRNPRPWLNAAMSAGAGAGPAALAIGRRGHDDRLGPSGTQEQDLRLSRSE